jgi:hypothetical protein
LEYLYTELECFLKGGNALDKVGIHLYGVGMLSTGLERFDRVGIPLYGVEMLSTGLICVLEVWNTFDRVGIPL